MTGPTSVPLRVAQPSIVPGRCLICSITFRSCLTILGAYLFRSSSELMKMPYAHYRRTASTQPVSTGSAPAISLWRETVDGQRDSCDMLHGFELLCLNQRRHKNARMESVEDIEIVYEFQSADRLVKAH